MTQKIEAIYEGGVLRPLTKIDGVTECARVTVTVEFDPDGPKSILECVGILPDEDAADMRAAIEESFERIDPRDWQ